MSKDAGARVSKPDLGEADAGKVCSDLPPFGLPHKLSNTPACVSATELPKSWAPRHVPPRVLKNLTPCALRDTSGSAAGARPRASARPCPRRSPWDVPRAASWKADSAAMSTRLLPDHNLQSHASPYTSWEYPMFWLTPDKNRSADRNPPNPH